jgi:NADH dehydrogenase [ubiquinone] 1 alpha subcomplex assembly factor 3
VVQKRFVTGLKASKLSDFDILAWDGVDGDLPTTIEGYDEYGFIVNQVEMRGSIMVFPQFSMLWNVSKMQDITVESLQLVHLMTPPVETLIIGCGETLTQNLPKEVYDHFKERGIVVEIMNSINASATYNILNSEERSVAAAILSIEPYSKEDQQGDA